MAPTLCAFGLVGFGVTIILRVPSIAGLGLGAFLVGALLAYLPAGHVVTVEMMREAFMPSMTNLEALLRGFGVNASATYIPPNDKEPFRVFVPLPRDATRLSQEQSAQKIVGTYGGNHETNGLLLEPPGANLLAMLERECDQDIAAQELKDLEEVLGSAMVESLELGSSVRLSFEDAKVHFILKGDVLWDFTQNLAEKAPILCERVGCPICSLAACALAKCSHSDVRFLEAKHLDRTHRASFELLK